MSGTTPQAEYLSEIVVRMARESDLDALCALVAADPRRRAELNDSLALGLGDDFFLLVAEDAPRSPAHPRVVGWCFGGGCRGQEHKGWGEIYELAARDEGRQQVLAALVSHAARLLDEAAFAGVRADISPDDGVARQVFEGLGFCCLSRAGEAGCRYAFKLPTRRAVPFAPADRQRPAGGAIC